MIKQVYNTILIEYYVLIWFDTDSCDEVVCPEGKYCLQDQNLMPHCVKCANYCPRGTSPSRLVCGSDSRTYQSACHLRQAACRMGKAIPIAYKGRCKSEYKTTTIIIFKPVNCRLAESSTRLCPRYGCFSLSLTISKPSTFSTSCNLFLGLNFGKFWNKSEVFMKSYKNDYLKEYKFFWLNKDKLFLIQTFTPSLGFSFKK